MKIEEMKTVLAKIAHMATRAQEMADIRDVRQIVDRIAVEAALAK